MVWPDGGRGPSFGLVAAVLSILLAIRIAALAANGTDLFFDEAQYWHWSTTPAFGYYSKPPLIAWLIAGSTAVCGGSEFCVRLPSPVLHTLSALAVLWLGTRLYDARVGGLAALAFALLPGVSFSSGIISTDVPLLLCWALALIGFSGLLAAHEAGSRGGTPPRAAVRPWWPFLLLGVAFGLGLNAKYAMAWFILCAAVFIVLTPERRGLLRDWRLWAGLALGLVLIAPNMAWNQANSFATFAHTADNAKWQGALGHPSKAAEFFISQFGVFGPFYFAGLLVIAVRASRTRLPEPDRLLLAFSIPLILAVTAQAFLSRAHANWAAPAYVAGTVLVVATLVRDLSWGWLRASYGLHAIVMAVLIAGTALAGRVTLPGGADPLARTMGWRALADATRVELATARGAGRPFAAVLTDDRSLSATLLYYLRNEPTPVRAWRCGPRPLDHFELTRPYTGANGEPVLLVSLRGPVSNHSANQPGAMPKAEKADGRSTCPAFAHSQLLGERSIPAGASFRRVTFFALSGYAGK